mmetsp:Transcript_9583/g.14784  ORF Transcript_9583/g.14784 Transcript_9583/m.14784 type:complete len:444 (+) Transcript_9583:95-1426(+)
MDRPLLLEEQSSEDSPLLLEETVARREMTASSFYQKHCIYLPAMMGWFICSAALSSYNKVIFGENHGHFPCPLLLTSVHFLVQWVFSFSTSAAFPEFFGGSVVKSMSWKTFLGVSIPCGFITALDVGLSNLSLVRISITFFTMIKSSSPIWVLISAFLFGLEKMTCSLLTVGGLIVAGELLTAFGEVEFDKVGFFLCLTAAVCSGIRWTLVQLKLNKLDPPLKGSVVVMRVLSPSMFIFMLLLSLIIERPMEKLGPEHGDYFSNFENGMKTISLGLTGAFIAIAMVLCEFWLILKSNAIVLMIGGVIKELITILVGVTIFGDDLNVINISGIVVVFMGVFLYKATLLLNNAEKDISNEIESNPDFSRINSDDVYEDEPPTSNSLFNSKNREKNSDPDLALKFTIDDIDEDDNIHDMNSDLMRRNNGASAFELDGRDEERLQII